MRIIFFLFLLAMSPFVAAIDYFVSNTGNDGNVGTSEGSAWATIARANSALSDLKPGDRLLFKRGDVFYGTIKILKSGVTGSPITIGAYGTGDKPVITGFKTIAVWTSEGNGIYSSPVSTESLINMVLIDGVQFAMGRWPDQTYNIFESANTNVSITDNDLSSTPDWTGAEAVIRKNDWSIDRCRIEDHTGVSLTYTSLGTVQNAITKHGYFIQNDIRTLSVLGEWYHDTVAGKIYIFFGNSGPSSQKVEVASLNTIIDNKGGDYITIDDISVRGSNKCLITSINTVSDHFTIKNSNLSFSGVDGIQLWGTAGTLSNNIISFCNQTAITTVGSQHTITGNEIKNIGLLPGQAFSGNLANGIAINNNDCLIKNNRIHNIGYCGIKLSSTADIITIQNNYLDSILLTMNDGGGIYTAAEGVSRKIDGNIITNVIGNTAGTPYPDRPIARGIYLDVNSTNVIITGNTVANCSESGYMIHRAHDNRLENNVAFNNANGMFFQNSTGSNIRNNTLKNNIFFAKAQTQLALKFTSTADDIPAFGTADYNYYARPADDDDPLYTYSPSTGYKFRTLAGWKSFTNQDLNSKKSPVTVTDTSKIDFYYNPTTSNKAIALSQPMIDVKGTKYAGSVTLLPYTSVILLPDPNPYVPPVPVFSGATVENSAPTVVVMSYSLSLASVIPATSAFTISVNGTERTVSSVSVSGNRVLLTLSSRVNYGDVITLSYNKPSASPLQTSEGAQAASLTSQSVKNNCAAPIPAPVPTPTPTPTPAPVPSNKPPVISIASPVKSSSYTTPVNVVIEVTAYDPDGSVESVILYNGNTVLGERTSVPFSFTLKDLEEGSYSIHAVATDNLKSSATSGALEFHVTAPEPEKGTLKLYPNPNNGQFSIDYAAPEGIEDYTVSVINMQGRTVMVEELSQNQYMKQYDLAHLMSGVYIIMISTDKILLTQKFIKK